MNMTQEDFDALASNEDDGDEGTVDDGTSTVVQPVTTLDGDHIPEELRGKSIDEALGVYAALKQFSHNLAAQQANPATPSPVVEPAPTFNADDIVEKEGAGFNDKLNKFFDAKTAPLMNQMVQTQALANRTTALANSPVLRDYEHTMNTIIAENNLDVNALANGQTWSVLEAMVTQRHVTDIAASRAAATAKPSPELTAGVQSSPEAQNLAANLTPAQKAAADGTGLSYERYAQLLPHTNQG